MQNPLNKRDANFQWHCVQSRLINFIPQTLASVMENLPNTNLAELLISLLCLAVLFPIKEVNTRFRERLCTPIPVEILTVGHRITFATMSQSE